MKDLSYEVRLQSLNIFSLEKRLLRVDMMHKYLNSDSSIGRKLFSLRSHMETHGHSMKLGKKRFNLKLRKGLFTVIAVRMCNSLSQLVIAAGNLANYKQSLDKHIIDHIIQGYGKW